jgi:hypothetical protein
MNGKIASHGAATKNQSRNDAGKMFGLLGLFFAGVGIAGVAAIVGFISTYARDEFLGIRIGIQTGSELTSATGEFAAQTVLLLLQECRVHYIFAPLLIICIILLCLLDHILMLKSSVRRHAIQLLILCVLSAGGLVSLVSYDLPVVKLRDVMITKLGALPVVADCGTDRIWTLLIDARIITGNHDPVANTGPCTSIERHDNTDAQKILDGMYAASVTYCIAGWLILYFNREAGSFGSPSIVVRTLAFSILCACTFFVPYVFGKIIRSPSLPTGVVSFKCDGTAECPKENVYVLSESGDSIILLEIDANGDSSIVQVPRERMIRLELNGSSDPLTDRIADWTPTVAP